jgi:hypothetical protein
LLAVGATGLGLGGFLVLSRSVAVRRIAQLKTSRKALHLEVSKVHAYLGHIEAMSSLIAALQKQSMPSSRTIQEVLETSNTMISGTRGEPSHLALVRVSSASYSVEYFAGDALLGIRAGKSCAADRAFEEVLTDLGKCWSRSPLQLASSSYELVLLTATPASRCDEQFVHSLACLIQIAKIGHHEARVRSLYLTSA